MTTPFTITANNYAIKYNPDWPVLQWTAVSPSGRIGDFATGNKAFQAVLDDQARRLCGYLLPGEKMTIGASPVRLVYVTGNGKE